ncbi:bacteriohemerythrin [bacterium]|jgi:hemerythrin|nr:bacteriohemerythrin [bacterium]
MNSFEWDKCFVTGLETVDEQHHELVNLINRFGELLMQSAAATRDEVDCVFKELTNYTCYHFKEEEALMHSCGLDSRHIKHHCGEHAKFLQNLTFMHLEVQRDDAVSGTNLLSFLTNWLAYHILGTDHYMARLMSAIKDGQTTRAAYLAEQQNRDPATVILLRSMTTLFNQVTERNRTLLELNQTLEARVASRTHELVDMNHHLEKMAMTDVLTGLPNRRHALRCLDQDWKDSTANDTPLACVMIDADGFKGVNDLYGHDAGDEVLRQLARRLKQSVRSDDVVCRIGGDEFLVICTYTSLDGAKTTAEKLRRDVSALRIPAGEGIWQGSVSVGVAERARSMNAADDLLKLADDAVYVAKRSGRNCVMTVQ